MAAADLTNHNMNNTNARKIVKQKDLSDFKYDDVYSVPTENQSLFQSRKLGFLDYFTTPPYPESLLQTTNQQGCHFSPNHDSMFQNRPASTITLPAVSEKVSNYVDDPIFVVIRASEKRNIDIAQSCNKWVFSPQTEKRILNIFTIKNEKTVYLVFFVKEIQMFMGIAEYKSLNLGKNFSKPTASIQWKFTIPLHKNKTKHLLNPYNGGKPIFDSHDGVIIQQSVGEELMRIYSEAEGVKI